LPTVVVTTTAFLPLTKQTLKTLGISDGRFVVIEHPLGGIEEPAVLARAETITEQVLELWTRR
jgi:hypothetical protein